MITTLDLAGVYDRIEAATKAGVPLSRGLRRLIDECARQRPHDDWNRLAELDFENDVGRLRRWLRLLLEESRPPRAATGLWFGLFNLLDDNDQMIADVYVTASVHNQDDGDWMSCPWSEIWMAPEIWNPSDDTTRRGPA